MQNRRQTKRHELLVNLPVLNQLTGKPIGFLLDINPSGFQIISESEFGVNEVVHLKITETPGSIGTIPVDAICRWCSHDSNPVLWRAGFLLYNETSSQAESIIQLICKLGW